MGDELPTAISEAELWIGAVRLRVYNLDDGRRVIHGDDLATLLASWNDGAEMSPADARLLMAVLRGTS